MKWTNLRQSRPASMVRAIMAALIAVAIGLSITAEARADKLAEFLFWHEMGKATNIAVKSYNDYQSERRRWRDNIAAAKAARERCGGCASAQAELDKWQGVENQFQDFAGSVFSAVGMPPIVAQWLGIQMPLARGFTAEEKARMCEVKRQPWVAERSALCQRKVDEHLACLRASMAGGGLCDWEAASLPGQACYRTAKYYDHCYNANYTAVELETKAQAERANGRILPEVVNRGTVKIVFFDDAADAFAPPLPPLDLAREIIDDKTQELKFRMRKSRAGTLRQATLKTFHWADFAADDRCIMPGAVRDEIELRVCEDLKEMNFIHNPLMLLCDYTDVNRALGAHAIFWYGERPAPAVADPRHFLKRSRNHPLAKVAGARSHCPATIEEAGSVNSRFQTSLASLGIEEVPGNVALRSNWDAERRAKQRAQQEAIRTEKLASFPIEGVYRVEFATAWYDKRRTGGVILPEARKKSAAECAMRKIGDGKFRLSCREPYKTALAQLRRGEQQDQTRHGALRKFEAEAVIERGWVVVHWTPDLSIQHEVRNCQYDRCMRLSGWHKPHGTLSHDTISSSMTRTGDLDRWDPSPQLGELPELRAYEGLLRSKGITSLEMLAALSDADIVADPLVLRRLREHAREFLRATQQGGVASAAAPPGDGRGAQTSAASRAGASAAAPAATPAPSAPAAASDTSLTGVWKGEYTCGGGPVALQLTLSELDGGLLWGTFAFAPTQQNPKFASGGFYVWGRKHESRLEVELVNGPWIDQPRGYVGVGLQARYGSRKPDGSDPSSGRIVGRITGPCAEVDVRRVADRAASLGNMPAEIERKLKQYGLQPTSKRGSVPAPAQRAAKGSGERW